MLQVLYSHGRLTHCGLGEDIARIFTCRQPHLDTVSPLVTTSTRRQCCFVTAETVTLSVLIMRSCLCVVCIFLLTTHSLCSVSEQTPQESTVGTLSSTAENATVEVLQPKGTITQQDKQRVTLMKSILYPCLLALGTFGNVMTIAIHKRTVNTSPMSIFFMTLAVADLLLLYSNCVQGWVNSVFHFSIMKHNDTTCKIVMFMVYVSGVLSAWALVAMTVQRAVCVLWPHRANVLCTVRKSKVIVVSMVLFITAIHVHILYGFSIVYRTHNRKCYVIIEYDYFFSGIWSWVDMLIFSLLPWLCLAIGNSLLVWKLKVSIREAEVSLGSDQADKINGRKKKATSITVTLVAVSTAFLILTFPMSFLQILNFVKWLNGTLYTTQRTVPLYYILQISYPLWYANSCINFYLYCLTGAKFRREAKQILACIFHEDIKQSEANTTVSTMSSNNETRFG